MKDDDLSPDLLRLVAQDEKLILPYQEVTEAINLRTEEKRKKVNIGTTLSLATRKEFIDLLQDYRCVCMVIPGHARFRHRNHDSPPAFERRMRTD